MSYVQLETRGGYVTRSITLATMARVGGYPGYMAEITEMRNSVRTILYIDNDRIYLTDDKTFILSEIPSGDWIFSADPNIDPLSLSEIQSRWGLTIWPWRSEWANMKNDDPYRNDLLWPVRTWEEAWNIISQRGYAIALRRQPMNGWDERWISPVDSFGGTAFVTGAFAWKRDPARFHLMHRDNTWGLQYIGEGTIDAEQTFSMKSNIIGAYVKPWNEGSSSRWLLTDSLGSALFFSATSISDGIYQLSYRDRRLNQGGCWRVRPFTICRLNGVADGVEFYNSKDKPAIYISMNVIEPSLSDTDRYLLSQNQFVNLLRDQNNFLPNYNPQGVTVNLPRGSGICNINEWDGLNVNCYLRANTPYTTITGRDQCTTLDDFSHDIHCQQWAIANRGPQMDRQLYDLCSNTTDEYDDVCSCFRPDRVYYDAILQQRRNDPELAQQIANDVRATNLLQCVSGLCIPGTFSANVFYHGSRRCDVCIQALRTNIQAQGNITGDINLRQICIQADTTYTWNELTQRLIDLGAYHNSIGIYPHVIINPDRSAIKLITTTPGGRIALSHSRLLSSIDNKDSEGNIILTQDRWRSNPSGYSNEILVFFLDARET